MFSSPVSALNSVLKLIPYGELFSIIRVKFSVKLFLVIKSSNVICFPNSGVSKDSALVATAALLTSISLNGTHLGLSSILVATIIDGYSATFFTEIAPGSVEV